MSPIRHVLLVRFKASVDADSVAAILQLGPTLRASVPDILYYNALPLLSPDTLPHGHVTNPAGFSHVLDSLFPSAAALRVYDQHPAHVALRQRLLPLVDSMVIVDVEMAGLDVDAFIQMQHAPHVHHLTFVRPSDGVQRAHIEETVRQWTALPAIVPELVWASAGHTVDKAPFEGYRDLSRGYSVVCDVIARDLPSMAAYSQHVQQMELTSRVRQMAEVEQSGLVAVDWQL